MNSFTLLNAHVAICMRHHPRGLKKEMRDEYLASLAPDPELFREWKALEKKVGHERAFAEARYEQRFDLSAKALEELRRLAELSRKKDVYLVCQCPAGFHCHREMLLLLAQKKWGVTIGLVFHRYRIFQARCSLVGNR